MENLWYSLIFLGFIGLVFFLMRKGGGGMGCCGGHSHGDHSGDQSCNRRDEVEPKSMKKERSGRMSCH